MKLRNCLLLLFLFIGTAFASTKQPAPLPEAACAAQTPYGLPASTVLGSRLICRTAYLVDTDPTAKIPVWVAYTLTPAHALGCVVRSNAFAADQSMPADQRSDPKDYVGSGYDIGHTAPDGDMSWDMTVEHESFILTNMTPQLPGLNRGIWKVLESDVRAWAEERGNILLIYAGPIYDVKHDKTIGPDKVDVPTRFFKIVVDTKTLDVLAFIFPQKAGLGSNIQPFQTNVDTIEQATGIQFPLPTGTRMSSVPWPVNLGTFAKAKKATCSR